MDLLREFREYIQKEDLFRTGDQLIIGVSGGVDSVVLCDLCHKAGFPFTIAHMNFNLRGAESGGDEEFVRQLGGMYTASVYVQHADTQTIARERKLSIQTAARELRYNWFHQLLQEQSVGERKSSTAYLLTAHHADDNIETVIMNFFRGTGIAGLRGILPKQGRIVRPLLPFRKDSLVEYANTRGLQWRNDSSNESEKYTRNYIRHTVIPQVSSLYPETQHNILQNISRFREIAELYAQAINMHRKELLEYHEDEVHIPVLKLRKTQPLRTILLELFQPYNFTAAQLPDIEHLLNGKQGKYVRSATHRVIRNRRWLIVAPDTPVPDNHIIIEKGTSLVQFPGGCLKMTEHTHSDIRATSSSMVCMDVREISYPLMLRKWRPGDYFYPLGMTKKKKVSRFLVDSKLSPTEKEKVWVLVSENRICWLVGLRLDNRFRVVANSTDVLKIEL